jgi:hypothetical protein
MNFFDHKDLGNHLLQLCPKVVKHTSIYTGCFTTLGHNSVTVQNRTHVYMNFFDQKDVANHLLQLCPKVVKDTFIYTGCFTTLGHNSVTVQNRTMFI